MPQRQTMNVSLPEAQEQFVRTQVSTGRYRTASEVVRDGLRLLQEAEHRRLVEKWIYEELGPEEFALLPEELKQRTRSYYRELAEKAREDVEAGRVTDGPKALARIRERLQARSG